MRKATDSKKIIFELCRPEARECKLLLYKKGKKTPSLEFSMLKKKNNIFSCEVELLSTEVEEYEYLFKCDEELVCDPKAKRIIGREFFNSIDKSVLRGGLVDFSHFKEDTYKVHERSELFLYELQVRSFTAHESSNVKTPGTFLGVTEKIPYLKKLGVTGVMLMPAFDFDENYLKGRVNLWGYECLNTFYFAPKASFAASDNPASEFKTMVEKLHKAGIDVYMDLVFDRQTKQATMLQCAQMYANIYGVDGFRVDDSRMDLGVYLSDEKLSNCRFFASNINDETLRIYSDRVITCNDGFKNTIRRYIKGDEGITRSIYDYLKERSYNAPLCYIADHNGFTLNDLYTYDVKHNLQNGENGKDGSEINYSWNCGEEGETNNRKIKALRLKMIKNAVLTTFLAGGIPMIAAGDEFGFTKRGNNNSYCQDNEISYIDWNYIKYNKEILSFVKKVAELRKNNKIFSETRQLRENDYKGYGIPEVSIHGASPWLFDYQPYNRLLGVYFGGDYVAGDGEKPAGDMYIIFNMHWEKHDFTIPERKGKQFKVLFDTAKKANEGAAAKTVITAEPRSIIVLESE